MYNHYFGNFKFWGKKWFLTLRTAAQRIIPVNMIALEYSDHLQEARWTPPWCSSWCSWCSWTPGGWWTPVPWGKLPPGPLKLWSSMWFFSWGWSPNSLLLEECFEWVLFIVALYEVCSIKRSIKNIHPFIVVTLFSLQRLSHIVLKNTLLPPLLFVKVFIGWLCWMNVARVRAQHWLI